ncbi:hypothetical protein HUJ05_010248 [Dendroctonus ponderosae]|nr:hypothetical protein HUJ05_010248 [Dendroctonus ponderosae]
MHSLFVTGRLISRALFNGIHNFSTATDPKLQQKTEPHLVSAVCGFSKERRIQRLVKGQFGDDAWFSAKYKSTDVLDQLEKGRKIPSHQFENCNRSLEKVNFFIELCVQIVYSHFQTLHFLWKKLRIFYLLSTIQCVKVPFEHYRPEKLLFLSQIFNVGLLYTLNELFALTCQKTAQSFLGSACRIHQCKPRYILREIPNNYQREISTLLCHECFVFRIDFACSSMFHRDYSIAYDNDVLSEKGTRSCYQLYIPKHVIQRGNSSFHCIFMFSKSAFMYAKFLQSLFVNISFYRPQTHSVNVQSNVFALSHANYVLLYPLVHFLLVIVEWRVNSGQYLPFEWCLSPHRTEFEYPPELVCTFQFDLRESLPHWTFLLELLQSHLALSWFDFIFESNNSFLIKPLISCKPCFSSVDCSLNSLSYLSQISCLLLCKILIALFSSAAFFSYSASITLEGLDCPTKSRGRHFKSKSSIYLLNTNRNFIFTESLSNICGVADGVGGWRSYGIDPGEFSFHLMKTCERLVKLGRFAPTNPSELLASSYYELLHNKKAILGCITRLIELNQAPKFTQVYPLSSHAWFHGNNSVKAKANYLTKQYSQNS